MADDDDAQEKTEDPSARKLEEAIEQGQILTSKELLMGSVLLMGAMQLVFGGRFYFNEFLGGFRSGLDITDALNRDLPFLSVIGDRFGGVILPLLAFMIPLVLVLVAAQTAFGGLHFVTANLAMKFSRISPVSGLSRMFGFQSIVELIKSIMKITLLGVMGVVVIINDLPKILELSNLPIERALDESGQLIIQTFLILVAGTAVICAFDAIMQWRKHTNQLLMSKQELKDEYKQSEGSPEVKRKIRQMQREAADRDSVSNLKDAQVIIVNPQHFAVALRYDFEDGTAPKVVAKGADSVAAIIKEQAAVLNLPILSYPLLARAIYYTSEVGGEIHSELYRAVASVLTFVYQTNTDMEPPEVEVPAALQFDANGRTLEAKS